MDEARSFLALPRSTPEPRRQRSYERGSTPEAARRLFCAGRPIPDTPAEAYLRARGITAVGFPALRFHPSVYYRAHDQIGSASCRERVGQYVWISVVAGSLKKKQTEKQKIK